MKLRISLVLFTLIFIQFAQSQSRIEYSINKDWKFHKGGLAFAQRSFMLKYPVRKVS